MTKRAQPSLSQFKSWSRDNAPIAKAVLMARVFAQMEHERVDAYVAPILARYQFTVSRRFNATVEPITQASNLYLSDDEPGVAAFFADCDDAHRAHGFTGPKGHCPALTAETIVREAEHHLIKAAIPLFGIESHDVYGDDRAKYLELLIGACMKAL